MARKLSQLFLFYIGTTKLCSVRVKRIDDTFFDVVNFNEIHPTGFEKGNVVDVERAIHDIRRLLNNLGSFADFIKHPVYLVIESALSSTYSLSSSLYFQQQKRIYSSDVNKVIDQTREVATLPMTEQLILSVAQGFIVNDLTGIRNPVGLDGTRLGVDLLLATLSVDQWKKIQLIFRHNGLKIANIIPKCISGVFGLLTAEEFKGSTLFLDVGGKLTSLAYIRDEKIRRSSWLTFGGENWTQRIVQGIGLPEKEARRMKEVFGSVEAERDFHDEIIPHSGRTATQTVKDIKLKDLQPILNEGMKDFLELLRLELDRVEKVEAPVERIVITGGGARMDGFLERLQAELGKPVRLAQPLRIRTKENQLVHPGYASFLGALRFLSEESRKEDERFQGEGFLASACRKAKDWFREYL